MLVRAAALCYRHFSSESSGVDLCRCVDTSTPSMYVLQRVSMVAIVDSTDHLPLSFPIYVSPYPARRGASGYATPRH